ncbi:hypothetical protein AAVH_31797 [Aphelenchoides avenae]|nr:hypothetical protein AAVH_31797 [Aphelenchus avenae]
MTRDPDFVQEDDNGHVLQLSNYEHWAVLLFVIIHVIAFAASLLVCALVWWRTYTAWSTFLEAATNEDGPNRGAVPPEQMA